MKSLELGPNNEKVLELHDAVTVVSVDVDARDALLRTLTAALGPLAVVWASDVPTGDRVDTRLRAVDPSVEAEAAVATAEAALADSRAALQQADRAYSQAQAALLEANRSIDKTAPDAVSSAEARLEVAQAGAAAARRALVQAREEHGHRVVEEQARLRQQREEIAALRKQRSELEDERMSLVERLGALPEAGDPKPVEDALAGLHRLRQVKPRPSERGAELADRWVDVGARLAALPQPPSPPEWLVTPALRALQEARDALAAVEALSATPVDPVKADAVELAHREVLDAEQRVMRKGSRTNRRRLEQAHEAEKRALTEFGVATYGDFLERVAPNEGGLSMDDRIISARAALADADAVWEELHGGQASPEYTATKSEQAEIRTEALALLGEEVGDDDLESRLRAHLETVVDTEWATEQLRAALIDRGVEVSDDLETAARQWLESVPVARAARDDVESRLSAIDTEVHDVDAKLAGLGADAFFADDPSHTTAGPSSDPSPVESSEEQSDPFGELTAALSEAETAEREAVEALDTARRKLAESESAATDASTREQETDVARAALDVARERVTAAENSLAASRTAAQEAVTAAEAAAAAEQHQRDRDDGDRAGAAEIAGDVWLLARLATARASATDRPVVVDARAVGSPGRLRLLERLSGRGQVVVIGDDGAVATWAASLGERAAVRTI